MLKRKIKKSLSWRAMTIGSSMLVSLILTGNMITSLKFMVVLNIVNIILYEINEHIWDKHK